MATNGYFFDGTTLGDATLSPYDDAEIAALYAKLGNFVIEDYLNELNVYEVASVGVVGMDTGAAMVLGYLYENDAATTIAVPSAANNRIDLITLRVSTAGQTVRLTRVAGVEAANPTAPAVPATDFPLAWIWLPAGYNAAADNVRDEDIHDMRDFNSITESSTGVPYRNLATNSELLLFSGANTGTLSAPEGWYPEATLTSIDLSSTIQYARSRSMNIVSNAGLCVTTSIPVTDGNRYTIKGVINITSGSVSVETSAVVGGGTIVKEFYQTGVDIEFTIRVDPLSPSTGRIQIKFNSLAAATDFDIGQLMFIEGNIPGNFCPKHEVVLSNFYLNDAAWNMTAKSTGTTSLSCAADFSGNMGSYIRGVIMAMRGRDSGSAANPVKMGLYDSLGSGTDNQSQLSVEGQGNDEQTERIGYVAVEHFISVGLFNVGVTASGAGTFDAELRVIGIIT